MRTRIDMEALTENRIQLHYAIQFLAATGAALAEPQPGYSHTSLRWNAVQQLFVSAPITARQPFYVALDPVNLILFVLDQGGITIAQFPLDQRTLTEGLNWLKSEIAKCGANAEAVTFLSYPPDDFPNHAIAQGAPFNIRGIEERKLLTGYYHETYGLLEAIATQTPGASPIYIWPHHFDMATLITLPEQQGSEPRSIGIGLSPGDSSYAEPYWYVSPYPYPPRSGLSALAGGGFWHINHWVGAVLKSSQLHTDGQLNTFLQSALSISQQLLQGDLR